MREIGKWARGLFAAGSLAAASGGVADAEARPNPYQERGEHQKPKESDTAWAVEAKAEFDAAYAKGDVEAMADVIRGFVQEYKHPTRGDIRESAQHNPMRVMDKTELQIVSSVGFHFLTHANSWGKEYPSLQKQVGDVLVRIDEAVDEPGPANAHKMSTGAQGAIERSQGFK